MTGTQSHESICGAAAAVDYLAQLGNTPHTIADNRPQQLHFAFDGIERHERFLSEYLLDRFCEFPQLKLWGIRETQRLDERVPTFSFTHPSQTPQEIARRLGEMGIFVWPGNHYALPFTEAAGLEPEGTLRIGLLHYNSQDEIDRLVDALHLVLRQ